MAEVLLTLVSSFLCDDLFAQSATTAKTSERILRSWATVISRPVYPKAALPNKMEGVVVVDVQVSSSGAVSAVNVIEAPSDVFARSAVDAVATWKFRGALIGSTAVSVGGKLTFYFLIRDGAPVVLYPAEVGYVGNLYWHGRNSNAPRKDN